MRPEVQRDIQRARDWGLFAVKWLRDRRWPGGTVIQVEGDGNPLCRRLDCNSGIDYIVVHDGMNYGISARAQRKEYAGQNTFTIRMVRIGDGYTTDSEYRKTLEAVRQGAITAAYQYHAYVNRSDTDWPAKPPTDVLSFGLAKRVEMFAYLEEHPEVVRFRQAHDLTQTQRFGYVTFDQMRATGVLLDHRNYSPQPTTSGYWDSLFANAPAY